VSYLLDTHTLLWLRLSPEKLPEAHQEIIADARMPKIISTITVWEISLKFAIGKLDLGGNNPEEFLRSAVHLGFQVMAPESTQFASFYQLAHVTGHKDPFDRMLIWQAIQNNLTLLSHDRQLPNYKPHGLMLA